MHIAIVIIIAIVDAHLPLYAVTIRPYRVTEQTMQCNEQCAAQRQTSLLCGRETHIHSNEQKRNARLVLYERWASKIHLRQEEKQREREKKKNKQQQQQQH